MKIIIFRGDLIDISSIRTTGDCDVWNIYNISSRYETHSAQAGNNSKNKNEEHWAPEAGHVHNMTMITSQNAMNAIRGQNQQISFHTYSGYGTMGGSTTRSEFGKPQVLNARKVPTAHVCLHHMCDKSDFYKPAFPWAGDFSGERSLLVNLISGLITQISITLWLFWRPTGPSYRDAPVIKFKLMRMECNVWSHAIMPHSCNRPACVLAVWPVLLFSKLNKIFFGYFDPEKIFSDNRNK